MHRRRLGRAMRHVRAQTAVVEAVLYACLCIMCHGPCQRRFTLWLSAADPRGFGPVWGPEAPALCGVSYFTGIDPKRRASPSDNEGLSKVDGLAEVLPPAEAARPLGIHGGLCAAGKGRASFGPSPGRKAATRRNAKADRPRIRFVHIFFSQGKAWGRLCLRPQQRRSGGCRT